MIVYEYLRDGAAVTARWAGDRDVAIRAAANALDAQRDRCGHWRYYAEEADEHYLIDPDDMAELGAALLDDHDMSEVYSLWCARSGKLIGAVP